MSYETIRTEQTRTRYVAPPVLNPDGTAAKRPSAVVTVVMALLALALVGFGVSRMFGAI